MVITEFYKEREDGVRLVRTYSDQGKMLVRNDGVEYAEAIDVEGIGYTYTEGEDLAASMSEVEAKAMAYDIITGVRG